MKVPCLSWGKTGWRGDGGGGVQKFTPLPKFPLLYKIQFGNQTFHDEVLNLVSQKYTHAASYTSDFAKQIKI